MLFNKYLFSFYYVADILIDFFFFFYIILVESERLAKVRLETERKLRRHLL